MKIQLWRVEYRSEVYNTDGDEKWIASLRLDSEISEKIVGRMATAIAALLISSIILGVLNVAIILTRSTPFEHIGHFVPVIVEPYQQCAALILWVVLSGRAVA